jgi:hypothetical protein
MLLRIERETPIRTPGIISLLRSQTASTATTTSAAISNQFAAASLAFFDNHAIVFDVTNEQYELPGIPAFAAPTSIDQFMAIDMLTATVGIAERSEAISDLELLPTDDVDVYFAFAVTGRSPAPGQAVVVTTDEHRNSLSRRLEGSIGDWVGEEDEIIPDDSLGIS